MLLARTDFFSHVHLYTGKYCLYQCFSRVCGCMCGGFGLCPHLMPSSFSGVTASECFVFMAVTFSQGACTSKTCHVGFSWGCWGTWQWAQDTWWPQPLPSSPWMTAVLSIMCMSPECDNSHTDKSSISLVLWSLNYGNVWSLSSVLFGAAESSALVIGKIKEIESKTELHQEGKT